MVKFDNSSSVTDGLVMSSAPHSADIQRLVNVSVISTEKDYVHNLEAQLFTNTSKERILQISGILHKEFIINLFIPRPFSLEVSKVEDNILNLTEEQIKLSKIQFVKALMNVSNQEY